MASIRFDLKDTNGVAAEIGDIIEVVIPEVLVWSKFLDYIEYYRPATKVRAKIYLPPSVGLRLKVLEIIEEYPEQEKGEGDTFGTVRVGQYSRFAYTIWDWVKI